MWRHNEIGPLEGGLGYILRHMGDWLQFKTILEDFRTHLTIIIVHLYHQKCVIGYSLHTYARYDRIISLSSIY